MTLIALLRSSSTRLQSPKNDTCAGGPRRRHSKFWADSPSNISLWFPVGSWLGVLLLSWSCRHPLLLLWCRVSRPWSWFLPLPLASSLSSSAPRSNLLQTCSALCPCLLVPPPDPSNDLASFGLFCCWLLLCFFCDIWEPSLVCTVLHFSSSLCLFSHCFCSSPVSYTLTTHSVFKVIFSKIFMKINMCYVTIYHWLR